MGEKPKGESRRDFLKLAVAVAPEKAAAEIETAGARLRKTQVSACLESARF